MTREDILEQMANAMINPELIAPGCPSPSGNKVRRVVLQRALDVAERLGWTLCEAAKEGK